MTPWHALAEAVLRQAVQDLFIKSTVHRSGATDANPTADNKLETLKFLTDESGAFAESRAFWCERVGKNPDHLRKTIIALLEGDDRLLDLYPGGKFDRAAALEETRALYLARKREIETAKARWLDAAHRRKQNLERSLHMDLLRRANAERRKSERCFKGTVYSSALDAKVAAVVDTLKDGPLLVSRVAFELELGWETARRRLEEAERRGLVERLEKGLWQLAPSSSEAAPSSQLAATG